MSKEADVSDARYLEAATFISFMGGLNRAVVEGKWPAFREAFHGFEVDRVAAMTPADVDRLMGDARLVRNRTKLEAVVDNAGAMAQLRGQGTFAAYVLRLLAEGSTEDAQRRLAQRFGYISVEGARNWLYATGHDVGEVTDKMREKYTLPD